MSKNQKIEEYDLNEAPPLITLQDELELNDIYYNFRFYIYLKREIDNNGFVNRYIDEVAEFDQKGNKTTIYKNNKNFKEYFPIRREVLELLDFEDDQTFIKTFVKENKWIVYLLSV